MICYDLGFGTWRAEEESNEARLGFKGPVRIVHHAEVASRFSNALLLIQKSMQEVYVHTLTRTWQAIAVAAVMGAFVATAGLAQNPPAAPAQGQPAAAAKKVKDQGEYDIFNEALKDAANPQKEIQDLDTWVQKYPESDYKWDRLYMYMQAYGKITPPQPQKMVDYGTQLMKQDMKTIFTGASAPLTILDILYKVTTSVPALPNPTPEQIELARKAAQQLKEQAEAYFVPANKPAATADAAWVKAKSDLESAADHSLLALDLLPANQAMARKDCAAAEPMYVKALQDRPNNSYISYQLANAMVCLQKSDPTMVPKAIYEFERAAVIDPTLGDPANNPKKLTDYADSLYTRVHGSDEGLAQLKDMVKQNPLPPDGFEIKSQAQIAAEKEADFAKNNPRLALWNGIKTALTAPDGEQYFADKLKDSAVPQLRGLLVEGKPACRSKELLVYVPGEDAKGPQPAEITIKLDAPLTGKPEAGAEVLWEGVPSAFTKSPFMLTMDAEKAKVEVKTSPCAPPAKRAPAKKK